MDSQFTTHNSQMNHISQGNHSAHTPLSPQLTGTTPSPAAGGWDMREMSWVLTHLPARVTWYTASDGFNRFPHSTGRLHPMGLMVVVCGLCVVVCGYSLLLAG